MEKGAGFNGKKSLLLGGNTLSMFESILPTFTVKEDEP